MDKASPTDSDFGASMGLALTGLDITDFITESIASNESFEVTRPAEFTFKKFPALAVELRLKIWNATLVERTVTPIPGGCKPPAILSVCRESRNVGIKHYTLFKFSGSTTGPVTEKDKISKPFGFFFNPTLDVVSLRTLEEEHSHTSEFSDLKDPTLSQDSGDDVLPPGVRELLMVAHICERVPTATEIIMFDLEKMRTWEGRPALLNDSPALLPINTTHHAHIASLCFLEKFWICINCFFPNLREIRMEVRSCGPNQKAYFERLKQSMAAHIEKRANDGSELHAWEKSYEGTGKEVLTLFGWKDEKCV